jgi:hypothetical protein
MSQLSLELKKPLLIQWLGLFLIVTFTFEVSIISFNKRGPLRQLITGNLQ